MNKIIFGLVAGVFTAGSLLAAPVVKIINNHPDAIAKVNENITFTISVSDEGKPVANKELRVSLFGDKTIRLVKDVKTDGSGIFKIETKLSVPGMVQCEVRGGEGVTTVYSGVVVAPKQIMPSRPAPADFNAYWNQVKKHLDALPMKPVITPLENIHKDFNVYSVEINTDDAPAFGYLGIKKGANPKSLPIKLLVHGAGTFFVSPKSVLDPNYICFTLNPHSLPNGRDKKFYLNARKTYLAGYSRRNPLERDKTYFNAMFRRLYRTLNFLKSSPQWDGKFIAVRGVSQGGGQAIAAAGLDSAVSCVVAHVPAICDHGGTKAGRISGWPRFDHTKEYQKNPDKVLQAVDYIDCVNFARNIKNASCFLSTGSIDRTCVPASVCAAFNAIPSKNKKLVVMPETAHSPMRSVTKAGAAFITESLKQVK